MTIREKEPTFLELPENLSEVKESFYFLTLFSRQYITNSLSVKIFAMSKELSDLKFIKWI